MRNGIYYVNGKTQKSETSCDINHKNSELSKFQCHLTKVTNVAYDPNLSLQYLPINVQFDVTEEGERSTPIDYSVLDDSDIELNNSPLPKHSKKRHKMTPQQLYKRKVASRLWHRRLAHASAPCVFKNSKVTIGMDPVLSEDRDGCCPVCQLAKFKRKPFNEKREEATRVGQILHTDVLGPVTPITFATGNRYALAVVDGYSRYLQTFVMKSRDQTPDMMKEACREIQSRYPGMGQFELVRCDQAGEFSSEKFLEILQKYGAKPQYSETDISEHNSTVERVLGTIEMKLRALLFESGFPANLWGQLIETATWIYNRTAHSALDYYTPYEKYYGKPPKLSAMRIIGSKCYVGRVKVPEGHKADPKSKIQYLIGYTSTGYLVYDPKTKVSSRQCLIRIDEETLYRDVYPSHSNLNDFNFPRSEISRLTYRVEKLNPSSTVPAQEKEDNSNENDVNKSQKSQTGGGQNLMVLTNGGGVVKNNPPQPNGKRKLESLNPSAMITRSKSKRLCKNTRGTISVNKLTISKTNDDSDFDIDFDNYGKYSPDLFQPKLTRVSYKKAVNDPKWRAAMQKELDAWERLKVCEIVPKSSDTPAVPTKWLLTIKHDGRYKARVVAAGNLDPEKYEKCETKSPTPGQLTVKWFLAQSVRKGWSMQQIDIDSAFLNGEIDRLKYIRIPPGFQGDPKTHVGKLNRPLYGLAIAPMCWFRTLTKSLIELGFRQSLREPCVFIKNSNSNSPVLILVYVDDFIISSISTKAIEDTIAGIQNRYQLKKLGYPSKFLGVQIERITQNSIFLHQEDCIHALLNEYAYDKTFLPPTPMLPYAQHKTYPNENIPGVIGKLP